MKALQINITPGYFGTNTSNHTVHTHVSFIDFVKREIKEDNTCMGFIRSAHSLISKWLKPSYHENKRRLFIVSRGELERAGMRVMVS